MSSELLRGHWQENVQGSQGQTDFTVSLWGSHLLWSLINSHWHPPTPDSTRPPAHLKECCPNAGLGTFPWDLEAHMRQNWLLKKDLGKADGLQKRNKKTTIWACLVADRPIFLFMELCGNGETSPGSFLLVSGLSPRWQEVTYCTALALRPLTISWGPLLVSHWWCHAFSLCDWCWVWHGQDNHILT
jgi:hypothetical protein